MLRILSKSRYSGKIEGVVGEIAKKGVRVSTRLEDRIAYSKDFNPIHLNRMLKFELPALPDAVVFPSTAEEISLVMQICNAHSVPVYIFGGASGVVDGATPYCGGIALSTLGLNSIQIDGKRMLVTAGAGVVGGKLEEILNQKGFTLRHSPQSLYCSTVGGWVATKASGQFSTKYGNIEDLIVSLKVVTPDGEILEAKPMPRKAFINPADIFTGSEGLLGVICEVTLKIRKIPEKSFKVAFKFESMDEAVENARKILQSFKPALLRIFDRLESLKNFGVEGVVMIAMVEGKLAEFERDFLIKEVSTGEFIGEKPVEIWLKERFNVSDISKYVPLGIVFDTIEVSCFWENAMKVYRKILKAIRDVDGTLFASCHASHFYEEGLCFYFTFAGIRGDLEEYYREVWEQAMNVASKYASLSHHHGIGKIRAKWLQKELGGYYSIFRDLKTIFDRKNILNPSVAKIIES
ncbi:MAG: FAD-binding oxidoreductase [Archaeoglobus sp.]|nr:FAD-binding oxidoreductase [Archaeoglobus sp.]